MTTPRLYLPREMDVGHRLDLGEEQNRYLRNVLRLREGDGLVLFSGTGTECDAVIRDLSADAAIVEILQKRSIKNSGIRITLAQALPKGQKMDFIVQKATELGISGIIPFHSSRSVPRLPSDRARHKTARWQKIAVEASRQCGRADVPAVADIHEFPEVLEKPERDALRMIFWEQESGRGIKEVLRDRTHEKIDTYFVAVGPEGGFEKKEIETAVELGYLSVSLGPLVLKVETAALAVLSILQYERGVLG